MSAAFPGPTQIARAADAGLGSYVCPLRPDRDSALRRTLGGLAVGGLGAAAGTRLTWDSSVVDGAVILLVLVALVVSALGLIALLGADGDVHLYEDGYVQMHHGQEDVVLYAADQDGEWLRVKSRTALFARAV
ncbi:hypothetical protein V3N99_16945 [Dermatophilaceae bacterium Soc4.6]